MKIGILYTLILQSHRDICHVVRTVFGRDISPACITNAMSFVSQMKNSYLHHFHLFHRKVLLVNVNVVYIDFNCSFARKKKKHVSIKILKQII